MRLESLRKNFLDCSYQEQLDLIIKIRASRRISKRSPEKKKETIKKIEAKKAQLSIFDNLTPEQAEELLKKIGVLK